MVYGGLGHPLSRKREIVTHYFTKPRYSHKHANHFGLNGPVWVLGSWLRPPLLKINHSGIFSRLVGFFLAFGHNRSYPNYGYLNTWYVWKVISGLICWLWDIQDQMSYTKLSYTLGKPSTQTNRRYLNSKAMFVSIMSEINIPYALQYLTLCAYIFTL